MRVHSEQVVTNDFERSTWALATALRVCSSRHDHFVHHTVRNSNEYAPTRSKCASFRRVDRVADTLYYGQLLLAIFALRPRDPNRPKTPRMGDARLGSHRPVGVRVLSTLENWCRSPFRHASQPRERANRSTGSTAAHPRDHARDIAKPGQGPDRSGTAPLS